MNEDCIFRWQGLLMLFLLCPLTIQAQNYNFQSYTVEEGIPQSQISTLLQDEKGYLWIGTIGGGVARFDGVSFKVLTTADGLIDTRVRALVEDKQGRIWVGTSQGISVINDKKGGIVNFTEREGLASNSVNDLLLDNEGNIWVATNKGATHIVGLKVGWDTLKGNLIFNTYTAQDGLSHPSVTTLLQDDKENIWLGTQWGITQIVRQQVQDVPTQYKLPVFHYKKQQGLVGHRVTDLLLTSSGELWVATDAGLSHLIRDSLGAVTIQNYTKEEGLCHNTVNDIFQDNSRNIWVATEMGVDRFKPRHVHKNRIKATTFTEKSGLNNNLVYTVLQDREDNIWFGTYRGLNKYAGKAFLSYTEDQGLKSNIVFSINKSQGGDKWVGTYGGITRFLHQRKQQHYKKHYVNYTVDEGLPINRIRDIAFDKSGHMWVATWGGGVSQLTNPAQVLDPHFINYTKEEDQLAGNKVLDIYRDSTGNLWFGTYGNGVSKLAARHFPIKQNTPPFKNFRRVDGLAGNTVYKILELKDTIWMATFSGLTGYDGTDFITYTEEDGLVNNQILTMTTGGQNNLWLGTFGGISRFNGHTFTNFTQEDGLNSNTVYSMVFDVFNNLWLGTNIGIDRFNVSKYRKTGKTIFKHYGKSKGFTGIECNVNAVYRDMQENLWFGTVRGAIRYRPHRDQPNLVRTKTNITKVKLFLEDTTISDGATLPYSQNYLTFNYTGICLTNPTKVRYRYKLAGFSKKWSPVKKENTATFSNLPPGQYTFKVISSNNEGVWNKRPTTFQFTITPPFWRQTWFYVLGVVILFGSIYGIIMWREKSYQRQRKRLQRRVKQRTEELQEQKDKLQSANQQLEKLSLVTSKTYNGITIADHEGRIEWMNDAFFDISGYESLEEFKKEKGETLVEASDNPHFQDIIDECVKARQSKKYEAINITKDGEKRWVASTLTPIFNENDQLKHLIIVDTDITERKHAEQLLKERNKEMTDSMRYAKHIQEAILPNTDNIKNHLPRSFIYFNPRDIVSGDFYWFNNISKRGNDLKVVAAVDCTGHGVPGAFMSMIGNDLLNRIIMERKITDPAKVLTLLNQQIVSQLEQKNRNSYIKDGMDMALCTIDDQSKKIYFAGAYRPLYQIREGELSVIEGNKYPIGGWFGGKKSFVTQTISYQEGDVIYMFSDGYPDQFGGPHNKKFMVKQFKQLLKEIHHKPMERQKQLLHQTIQDWKGEEELQIDDMLIVGIKF